MSCGWRPFVLLCLLCGSTAWAANPYLEQARAFYEEVQYEQCVQRAQQAQRQSTEEDEQVQISLYLGLCQFSLGREAAAREAFSRALSLDRDAALPPFTSPKAVKLFEELKDALPSEPAVAEDTPRKVELTPAVKEVQPPPPVVARAPAQSRVVPAVLGGVAVASAGAGTLFLVRARALEQQANAEPFESTAYELGASARSNMTAAWIGFGVATAAATAAVLTFAID